ncbi:MAG: ATP-dependent DNA helicase [Myxococcota bacterium]
MPVPSVDDVLQGLLRRVHPTFEARAAQLEMARIVERILSAGGVAAIEAPTGVGKTLAYLVPALLAGRRVIVSTHTKNLQDQIVERDLPLLARALGEVGVELSRAEVNPPPGPALRYALMKGRANYLCLERLDRRRRQGRLAFAQDPWIARLEEASTDAIHGDRAELGVPEDAPWFDELDARAETCLGLRCPRYDDCFVVKMRRQAAQSSVVIVNHHLLAADMALVAELALSGDGRSFGAVLPEADALIVDEAHALEEIAGDYFGGELSSQKIARLARDVSAIARERRGRALADKAQGVSTAVNNLFGLIPEGPSRIPLDGPAAEELRDRLREKAQPVELALEALAAELLAESWDVEAEALARRSRTISEALAFVTRADSPDFAYWAERRQTGARLGASPIEVKGALEGALFARFPRVILTSATLTAGGEAGFRYFLERIGAPPVAERHVLETPFDYPRQAAIYVPKDLPAPDHAETPERLAHIGLELIELVGGGAFFLFTSHRAMQRAAAVMRPRLRFPLLVQGEGPRSRLVETFVERAPAVLLGTASFWEGVDVPGDPLRLVIIDRLPFASPADPVTAARIERFAARGQSAFSGYQLPQAILRLKQGFGRLVRGRTDRGVVAVLDPRIHERSYGAQFLSALPPATRVFDLPSLRTWVREQGVRSRTDTDPT